MTKFIFGNNAGSRLAAPITSGAVSLTMDAGTGALFPSPGAGQQSTLTVTDAGTGLLIEIIYYTTRTGDVFTGLLRGQEGTTARAYSIHDPIAHLFTAGIASVFAQNPSDAVGGVSAVQSYAGNPNGHVAGNAGVAGTSAPSMVWDTTDNLIWVCTTSGVAAAAVWVAPDATQNIAYCGLATGTANAIILTPTIPATSYVAGNAYSFIVNITNTNATVVNISGLGNVNLYKESPSGPIPLTGGELVAANLVSMRFDGTQMQLTATELGTAALKNTGNTVVDPGTGALEIASPIGSAAITGNIYAIVAADRGKVKKRSNSGTAMADTLPAVGTIADGWWVNAINVDATAAQVIATVGGASLNGVVSGSVTLQPLQNVVIGFDGTGFWITQSAAPPAGTSPAPQYINSTQAITSGEYLIDSSAGGPQLVFTLPPSPTSGSSVRAIDGFNSFGTYPVAFANGGGGNTIMGSASNFIADVSGADFILVYKSNNWSQQ